MKYRICYQKNDALIFISHLDLQKTFQRSFRRAGIRLAYSEGFSPHPKMTYSPPLSLFVSSAQEYLDVELHSEFCEEEIFKRLSASLPESLVLNSVHILRADESALSELVGWGEYRIVMSIPNPAASICDDIHFFYDDNEQIFAKKKNKKKQWIEKDIKPGIGSLRCKNNGDELELICVLSLENDNLLNPNLMIQTFIDRIPTLTDARIKSIRKIKVSTRDEK
ncbi:MAG: TIGR03936 family radical SAM-associated protein [Anaerofustis sp.]